MNNIHSNSVNSTGYPDWVVADLEKSGLVPDDFQGLNADSESYSFVYYDLEGKPIAGDDGKPFARKKLKVTRPDGAKYLTALGAGIRPFFPKDFSIGEGEPLLFFEGEKKSVRAMKSGIPCVGLAGISCWRAAKKSKEVSPLVAPLVRGREIIVGFDSDALEGDEIKPQFLLEAEGFAAALTKAGAAAVAFIIMPAEGAGKIGLDDWLVSGRGKDEFYSLPRLTLEELRRLAPWPELLPWPCEGAAPEFPLEALPEPLRLASLAIAAKAQSPVGLAAPAVLAGICAAASAVRNVVFQYPGHCVEWPIAEFFLTLAASGERKTTIARHVEKPFREFEAKLAPEWKEKTAAARAEHAAWFEVREGVKARIRSAAKKGDDENARAASRELQKLEENEPPPPFDPRLLLCPDSTTERLARDLQGWPVGLVFSAEAGGWLGGFGMSADRKRATVATLCSLFDGERQGLRRVGEGASVPPGSCRLSLGLAMQPTAWAEIISEHGDLADGVGLLPRLIVSEPPQGVGFCEYRAAPEWAAGAIENFQSRILSVLECGAEPFRNALGGAEIKPEGLPLTREANSILYNFMLETEKRMSPQGDLAGLTGHGRRGVEHAARLGAAIELFISGGDARAVEAESISAGIALARWNLANALRLVGAAATPKVRNARRLEAWMMSRGGSASRSDALQYGPVRCKDLLSEAVSELFAMGRGTERKEGRVSVLELRPLAKTANSANFRPPDPPPTSSEAVTISKTSEISKGGIFSESVLTPSEPMPTDAGEEEETWEL